MDENSYIIKYNYAQSLILFLENQRKDVDKYKRNLSTLSTLERDPGSIELNRILGFLQNITDSEILNLEAEDLDLNDLLNLGRKILENIEINSLTRNAIEKFVKQESVSLEPLVLDKNDCETIDIVADFLQKYSKYGTTQCIDLSVQLEYIKKNPELLQDIALPVQAAMVSSLDKITKKEAFQTYNTDETSDDHEVVTTMERRKKRKIRNDSPPPVSKTKKNTVEPDSLFMQEIKKTHASNKVYPRLFLILTKIIPKEASQSLLTCPPNFIVSVIDPTNYYQTIQIINKLNLGFINKQTYMYELLKPLSFYGETENSKTMVLWFISKIGVYFNKNAENFEYLRKKLHKHTPDPDRVALFMIKYNFLWFYRDFISTLSSLPTSAYPNQQILNILHVQNSIVQKNYERIKYNFNNTKLYVGPVDDIIKIMTNSYNDILL
jgi:Nucleopolyhedrovirus capsid protein P87